MPWGLPGDTAPGEASLLWIDALLPFLALFGAVACVGWPELRARRVSPWLWALLAVPFVEVVLLIGLGLVTNDELNALPLTSQDDFIRQAVADPGMPSRVHRPLFLLLLPALGIVGLRALHLGLLVIGARALWRAVGEVASAPVAALVVLATVSSQQWVEHTWLSRPYALFMTCAALGVAALAQHAVSGSRGALAAAVLWLGAASLDNPLAVLVLGAWWAVEVVEGRRGWRLTAALSCLGLGLAVPLSRAVSSHLGGSSGLAELSPGLLGLLLLVPGLSPPRRRLAWVAGLVAIAVAAGMALGVVPARARSWLVVVPALAVGLGAALGALPLPRGVPALVPLGGLIGLLIGGPGQTLRFYARFTEDVRALGAALDAPAPGEVQVRPATAAVTVASALTRVDDVSHQQAFLDRASPPFPPTPVGGFPQLVYEVSRPGWVFDLGDWPPHPGCVGGEVVAEHAGGRLWRCGAASLR